MGERSCTSLDRAAAANSVFRSLPRRPTPRSARSAVLEAMGEHHATLASDPLRLREARRWLVRLLLAAAFLPEEAHALAVAFGEACANVHRHSYGGRRDGRVDVAGAIR